MNEYEQTTKEKLDAAQARLMREHQLADDFRGIMATDGGRRFIWYMLEQFGAFKAMPVESHAQMAYMEGRRNVGLMLISTLLHARLNAILLLILLLNSRGHRVRP